MAKSDKARAAEIRRLAKHLERCAWGEADFADTPMLAIYTILGVLNEYADMKSPRKPKGQTLPQPD